MQTQFQYIVDLAKIYKSYSDDQKLLYNAINELQQEILQDIYKEYGDSEKKFQPVNLLRAEIARQLLEGTQISEVLVEDIKEKIRVKDLNYFNHLDYTFLEELKAYPVSKRDMFANWQNPWNTFHTFFYRRKEKETVQIYLEQISKDLVSKLDLSDYIYHWVDFQGSTNFGSVNCWIALYPMTKFSHKDAYQFFVELSDSPQAGIIAGHSIKKPKPNSLKSIWNYDEGLKYLSEIKSEVLKLNEKSKNYFMYSPGSQASEWETFYSEKIAGIDFSSFKLGDLKNYKTKEQIKEALGLSADEKSAPAWNMWLFKTANIGDVVFVRKGVNSCLGIGIIDGPYYYDEQAKGFNYRRKVNWITDKIYQYKSNSVQGIKNLFGSDSFSPTRVWEFLLNEYTRLYPELIPVFEKNNIIFSSKNIDDTAESVKDKGIETLSESEEPEDLNFWWLNANPNIWEISKFDEGQKQTYTTHNEKGNKRRIYKYFESVKPGDLMIGYESTPTKQIKAIFEITKGIHNTDKGEEIEFALIEKLEFPVHWNDLKNDPSLQKCEVFINNQGSLFRLKEEEYDIIREVIDNRNIITEKLLNKSNTPPYKFSKDNDKPFISESDFLQAVALIKRKKNVILQGPPGVGKTFIARKLAYEIMHEVKDANIEMIQFHQSYSYEDFIQGLRPTKKGNFELQNGMFYNFCQRAIAHPGRPFFFIIDEINRGNLSKIFGELLMLIEADKRGDKFAIKLTYSEDEEDRFYVPENMHIIGTMNTADRSLAIVDYALRRRFAFINLQPEYGKSFRSFLSDKGLSIGLIDHICSSVSKLNKNIIADKNLGNGFQIGHSYFCAFNDGEDENKWWDEILSFEIRPLLEEIWFDDISKVDDYMKQLSK